MNLFLWLDYRAQQVTNQASDTQNETEYSQVGNIWDRIIGTFISPSDTLAQWIMAIFTIAVVYLVWKTLVATQNMARETTRIGEAQVRAYLLPTTVHFQPEIVDGSAVRYHFRPTFKNTGQSPALIVDSYGSFLFGDNTITIKSGQFPFGYYVGAGEIVFFPSVSVSASKLRRLHASGQPVKIEANTDYRDIFHKPTSRTHTCTISAEIPIDNRLLSCTDSDGIKADYYFR